MCPDFAPGERQAGKDCQAVLTISYINTGYQIGLHMPCLAGLGSHPIETPFEIHPIFSFFIPNLLIMLFFSSDYTKHVERA